jgi:membrane fusion protein (multidrug efflux system)
MILRFIIALVLLALVGGGIVGFNMFRDQAIQQFFANMPVAPVTVSTVTVEPAAWTPGIETIGTASASQGVDLTMETSGVVTGILFSSNQKVSRGDVLVQLDDAIQRADLEAGQAQAQLNRQTLERALELQRRGVGSEVTVTEAQAAASASQAQLAKLQAALDQRQLRAPFDGTIGIPRIDIGQYLSPSVSVATLQDLETMRADFSVTEQQLRQISIGQPVRYGANRDGFAYSGTITGIDPKVDPATRLVAVRSEIVDAKGDLSPGQYIRVRVELPREDDVVALPQTALVTSLYGDYVYAVRPAEPGTEAGGAQQATPPPAAADASQPTLQAAQVFVKVGRRNDGLVEITEGVKAGDQIVTAGQNRLSTGSVVVVDNSIDLSTQRAAAAR